MADCIVSDWIGDFNSLEPQQLKTFAALHAENHELSTAIHTILHDKSKHQEVSNIKIIVIKKKRKINTVNCIITNYNFSIYIRFAINYIISIDQVKMN